MPRRASPLSTRPTSPPSLPPRSRRWLTAQIRAGRFASEGEAIGYCVDQAVRFDESRSDFDRLIAEGDKGPFESVDAEWWKRFRAQSATARGAMPRRKSA